MSTIENHDGASPDLPSEGGSGTAPGSASDPMSTPTDADIRLLTTAAEMEDVVWVFQQVWGSVDPLVRIELLMAISHSGGYVSAAYRTDEGGDERILGASVAMLARHHGAPALHSHITGLLPGARRAGLGRAMKLHQQQWARENGIEWIVWTYDPLVRRNAWFNLAVLGAEVHDYLESFYGTMTDAINAGDESDRLLVAWDVHTAPDAPFRDGDDHPDAERVPTPEDIVALRRTDPAAALRWRASTRERLESAF